MNAYHYRHPQIQSDDILHDTEFKLTINKLYLETLHETALECVKFGIYKNLAEAMRRNRELYIEYSNYPLKHLLFKK